MAKSVGWTRSIPVTVCGAEIASVTENPDSAAITGSIAAMVAANTGSVASSSAPIRGHCEPWPENTHTGPRSSWPTAGSTGTSLSATSRSAATSSVALPAVTAVAHRPVRAPARQGVAEIGQRRALALLSTQSASRPAETRSCSADVADNGEQLRLARRRETGSAGDSACTGACSRTACTLVPDIPYDETAARRGRSPLCGHGVVACGTNSPVSIAASLRRADG